jgi:hypothetical protein
VKKTFFKPYDFLDDAYYYKSIRTNASSILTFNSKNFLVIKYGQVKGLRFKVLREVQIDLSKIPSDKPLCLLLKKKPYKILQYVNESEVIDVSGKTEILGRKIIIKSEQ